MTQTTTHKMHPAALMYAQEEKAGKLSRREFLSRTTALGVTTAAAYGLLGLTAPAKAAAHIAAIWPGATLAVTDTTP